MAKKLAELLSNHPDEEEHVVIARSHHILFKTGHSDRRSGKFKFDREELTASIASVPLKSRMNYRHLATKIGVPRTTGSVLLPQAKTQASFQSHCRFA
jgi:hypothetical protein